MNILVTAGPTREYFDPVRFLSNPSSGKMGFAIAAAAARRGHVVTLVAGPVHLPDPPAVTTIHVTSARQMAAACKAAFQHADAVIMTAAVCDYRPEKQLPHKLAKQPAPRHVTLVPTEDILAALGQRKRPHQILIGFALEDRQARRKAQAKLKHKNLDAIVLNGPENIGADQARVQVLTRAGRWQPWPRIPKTRLAARIVRLAEQLAARA